MVTPMFDMGIKDDTLQPVGVCCYLGATKLPGLGGVGQFPALTTSQFPIAPSPHWKLHSIG